MQALAKALLLAGLLLCVQTGLAQAQTGDRVAGYASLMAFHGELTLDVQGSATGANPTGTYRVTLPSESWEATPKCMRVAGDRATLGLSIDSTRRVLLWVHEVAGPGTIYGRVVGASTPIACADPLAGPDPSFGALYVVGYLHVGDVQPPPPSGSDFVTGGAEQCLGYDFEGNCAQLMSFSAGAASGPFGGHPRGSINLHQGGLTPGGSASSDAAVTCLSVHRHRAIIGITGSRHNYGASEAITPFAGLARVIDGGGPDAHADTVEFAIQTGTRNGPSLSGPAVCSKFPGPFPTGVLGFPPFSNASSDLIVHDARRR